MQIIQPDTGSGIEISRYYNDGLQIWRACKVKIGGHDAEIRLPAFWLYDAEKVDPTVTINNLEPQYGE